MPVFWLPPIHPPRMTRPWIAFLTITCLPLVPLASSFPAATRLFRRLLPEFLPAQAPGLAAREDAMAWLDAERLNLHAVTTHAAVYGKPVYATAIPAAIHAYLRNRGYWDQALTLHHAAVETARRAGDQLAEACALTDIGDTQHLMADYPAATVSLTEALQLLSDLGHHVGEAGALYYLGAVQRLTGDARAAAVSLGRALELYQGLRNPIGEANALNYLGALQYLTGDYAAAVASLDRALELYRRLGNRNGEANARAATAAQGCCTCRLAACASPTRTPGNTASSSAPSRPSTS